MILFKIIRWKNFLSTGNAWTEVRFNKAPNTLVVGANGAGKSTMIDALTFALFGKPFRNINKPDLLNSINLHDCLVEVEFDIGHREYKVVRGMAPDVFEIYQDGRLLDQSGNARDYQKILEKTILRFNYKAFTQIVVLSAAAFTPFMSLTAMDRRMIIEDLLDIQIFTAMNNILRNRLVANKSATTANKISFDAVKTKIDLHAKYVEEAKKSTSEAIEAKTALITQSDMEVAKLEQQVELIQRHIRQLNDRIMDQGEVRAKLNQYHTYETQIEGNKKKKEKDRKFYFENNNCPTCRQELAPEFKKENLEKANTAITQFDFALKQLEEKQNELNIRLNEIQKISKEIASHNAEVVRINATKVQIQAYIKKLQSEIQEIKAKPVLSEDMLRVSETLVQDLERHSVEAQTLKEERRYQEVIATLLKDSGIKAKIIKQYLPIINKLVNKYLTAMDFYVNFEINEEFEETIKSRHRDKFKYGNFSEGEKLRIDLALLFAWRAVAKIKNSMNTNLLILDEVFDSSMDITGTEEFLKLIQSFGPEINIFVISHKSDINIDKFSEVLRFEKINLFSRIV
jgi:DNA repair exonuclease SbcCD ATPase subunit